MVEFNDDLLGDLVPVFPLPNGVLLPGAVLPLHLFEPRYCQMMRDLLERDEDRRLIAMALLKEGFEPLYHTNRAAVHDVLCVGRILHHEELDDGRYNLLLLGCRRARIKLEDKAQTYRLASLTPIETVPSETLDEAPIVGEFHNLLRQAVELEICPGEAMTRIVEAAPRLEALVDLLSFHFIPGDEYALKQRVLEEPAVVVRTEILARRLQALLAQARRSAERAEQSDAWPPPQSPN